MTSIHQRAVRLAERVSRGELDPAAHADPDWHLLLLAADVNNQQSLPLPVCRRVLDRAGRRAGFFAAHATVGTPEYSGSDAGPR